MENKSKKSIRILHVVTAMNVGGIETTIMNYMRKIQNTQIQFDFLVHRNEKAYFDDEILSLGGVIHYAPRFSFRNILRYNNFLNIFFKENNYDIVHSHMDSLSYFPLKSAKNNGINIRIAHSHVNGFDHNLSYPIRTAFKKLIPCSATHYMACSESAGTFMFGKKEFSILLNPVDIEKFKFNQKSRFKLRKELKIGDKVLIGHVGRFDSAKNHKFILKIAQMLPPDKYHFILIGVGVLKDEIENEVKKNNINNISFLGVRENVYDYLSAMDIFILPSFYEGLGIVAIESQVNGLPTLISEGVSSDVSISNKVYSLPLEEVLWTSQIESIKFEERNIINKKMKEYDLSINTLKLIQFYSSIVREI